jgi:hypothetical protein
LIGLLTFRSAYLFLTADDERLAAEGPQRFTNAWMGLLVLSCLWALAAVGLWNLACWLFGWRDGTYLLAATTVAFTSLLWLYRRGVVALGKLLAGPDRTSRTLLVAAVLLAMTICLSVLRSDYFRPEPALPDWLRWIRPDSKIDRILLLMPLWGAWSMLILPLFRSADAAASPAAAAMGRGCGPLTAAVLMGVLMAASIGYFTFLPWTQLSIPAAAIAAAIGGGLLLARRNGRMDRHVLLATNVLTQLAVLVAYLANRDVKFW